MVRIVENLKFPLRLRPNRLTKNIWGGRWIPRVKGLAWPAHQPVGESWEYAGAFLLKLIDARENLSVQVHPSDAYAKRVENSVGKAESWVILEADRAKDRGCLYIGFSPNKAARYAGRRAFKKAFMNAVAKGDARLILSFLNRVKVKPGEVYNLKPGTIHAIGAGVRLFEIQQNTDLTYRVWDWNRFPPRPLHLDKARDVLDFTPRPPASYRPKKVRCRVVGRGDVREEILVRNPQAGFACHLITMRSAASEIEIVAGKAPCVLMVVGGRASIVGWGKIQPFHSYLIPSGRFRLKAETPGVRILKSYVP